MNITILILDLDGVLITTPSWKADEIHLDGYSDFNTNCVNCLNELLSFSEFEIWLSSSRRKVTNLSDFNLIFKNRKILNRIKGFIPNYQNIQNRKEEIERFITELNINNYLIIDDDKSLNNASKIIKSNLIQTAYMIGFNKEKLKEAKNKVK